MLPGSRSVPHVSMDILSHIPSIDIVSHIPGIEDVISKPPQPKGKVTNNLKAREEASINLRSAGLALDTCDGAMQWFVALDVACPGAMLPSTLVDGKRMYSPSSCGNHVCAEAISSFDDAALSLMKAGFTACGALPAGHPLKEYEMYKDWMNTHDASEYLLQFARDCGLPASTVKLTPPALYTCDGALQRLQDFSK